MKRAVAVLVGLFVAASAFADVAVIERSRLNRHSKKAKTKHGLIKNFGDQMLIDAAGVEYFINTNVSQSSTASGSGAATDAAFTGAVNADTSGGGTVSTTLDDAFAGYNSLCVSLTGATGPCDTSDAGNYTLYTQAGPATLDAACGDRQVINPIQTIGNIQVQRKIFVPSNDQFARWVSIFTNTGGAAQSVTAIVANNLGSDANTTVVNSSNGNSIAELSDSWITSDGNFVSPDDTDPRLGHILQGPGARSPLTALTFVDGDDEPTWAYAFSLAPGESKVIVNYVTVQATRAAATTKSADIAGLTGATLDCLTATERSNIVNFEARGVTEIPTVSEFGLAALALLLAGASFFVLRRRTA